MGQNAHMAEKLAVVFDDFKSKNIQVKTYPNPSLYFCMPSEFDTCPVTTACADLLLTDQKMPDMSGLEFLQAQYQRGPGHPEIPLGSESSQK